MTGLMLKDMYSLRTYFLKQLALMTVLYLAISVGLMKNFSFLSPMLTMSVVMMLISSFSVDEASRWDSYALTLPVTPRAIVGAKYLLFYGALLGTGVIASVLCGVLDSFTYRNGFLEIAASTGGVIVVYMLVTVFMLPLFFKLGAEKARVAMVVETPDSSAATAVVPFLLIVWGFSWLGDGAAAFVESLPWPMIAMVGGLILVLLCAASFFVSVKFYESKEY